MSRRGNGGWWGEKCRRKNGEMRKELRRCRKEEMEYKKKKAENNKLCEGKKKEERERWKRKAAEVKRNRGVGADKQRNKKKKGGEREDRGRRVEGLLYEAARGSEGKVVMRAGETGIGREGERETD